MSDETILMIIGAIQVLLTLSSANRTASASSLSALSEVVATLRSEVKEVTKARQEDKKLFEREIERRDAYIKILVELLNKHQISVPEMPDNFDRDG